MIYDRYASIVIRIDIVLFVVAGVLFLGLVLYALVMEYISGKRRLVLLNVKKNLQVITTSGQEPISGACPTLPVPTAQQFLDIEMNRGRVAFDGKEREFIRKCLIVSDKIPFLWNTAASSGNKWRRIEALLSLGYAQNILAISIMEKALYDKDEDVSYYSMLALGLIKNVESAKILLDYLKKNIFGASKIVSVLETFPDAIVDDVAKLMDDAAPLIRFWAIKLIATFKPERYAAKVAELTRDASADVRAAACMCLGKIGKKEALVALLDRLEDKAWFVRMHAVRALSAISITDAMPAIITLIKDDSLMVKESVKAIMAQHIKTALPFIERILSGDDELAGKEAVEAIELSGYAGELLKGLVSADPAKKANSEKLLRAMIKDSAHFGIETALDGFTEDERGKALSALKAIDRSFGEHLNKKIRHETDEP